MSIFLHPEDYGGLQVSQRHGGPTWRTISIFILMNDIKTLIVSGDYKK